MKKLLLTGLSAMICISCLAKNETAATFAKQPPHFLENNGQIKDEKGRSRTDIDFTIKSNALSVFISNGRLSYQWYKQDNGKLSTRKMDIVLEGANPNPEILTEKQQTFTTRFINEKENIACLSYDKVTYKNVYKGIDWVLYIKDDMLEYDFVVHEGAKVSDIRLAYDGASQLKLKKDGSALAVNPMGEVTQLRPVSFTTNGTPIASAYRLNKRTLTFDVAAYEGTLVIDPVLEWSTYYGGTANDMYEAIDYDGLGNVYVAGVTASTSFIATNSTTHQGGMTFQFDGFVSRFDVAGNLAWTTYYGTSGDDYIYGIAADGMNAVYITGYCDSNTTNRNAFVAKLSVTGNALNAISIDGPGPDICHAICCDAAGGVYVGGHTESATGISTLGSFQSAYGGNIDGFITKLDTQLTLIWSTYYGDTMGDQVRGICADPSGHIYVTGTTASTIGISTVGTSQPVCAGGSDAFVSQFNATNGFLNWGTYLGGPLQDNGAGIDVDGAVYITGSSNSPSGISTTGSHQPLVAGFQDAIIAKYNSSGIKQWCTFYGGAGSDFGNCINVTAHDVIISGHTQGSSLLVTNGFQQTQGGGSFDAFVAKFNKSSGAFGWASYYGGVVWDISNAITTDLSENIYIAGYTTSPNAIAVNTNVQVSLGGGQDGFVAKINDCDTLLQPIVIAGDDTVCAGSTITYSVPPVTYASLYVWTKPNGWTGNSYTETLTVTAGTNSGSVTLYAYNNCDTTAVVTLSITVVPAPTPTITQAGNILSTGVYTTYQWYLNGSPISGATSQNYTATQGGSYYVVVTDANGCSGQATAIPVGIGNVSSAGGLSLYPNPNTGKFTISGSFASSDGNVSIEVLDIRGSVVYKEQLTEKQGQLSMSLNIGESLAPGVYTIKVHSDVQNAILPFVKK